MSEIGSNFKHKVLKSFLWLGTGTFFGQAISWASTIFVIRMLLPADYGLMAMTGSVIMLLNMVSQLGINAAIIQASGIKKSEIENIFGMVIVSGLIGWLLCCLTAPLVAGFYREARLVPLIRVTSITLLLTPLYIVPESLLIRDMNFKSKTKVDVASQVVSSIVSLVLAATGFGVWSLVYAQISLPVLKTLGYNLVVKTLYIPRFSPWEVWGLIRFGLIVTGDRLLYYSFTQSDVIIVGKILGDKILGIYAVALNLASIPAEKVLPIITQVSFASYSRIQDDLDRIRRNVLRATRLVSLLSFPLFFGMSGVAPEAIPIILGPRWSDLVLPFQMLCLVLPFKSLWPILPPAVFAIGRPSVNLVNMAIATGTMILAFLLGASKGLTGLCVAWILFFPLVFLVTSLRCVRAIDLPLKSYLGEAAFPLFASLIMLACIHLCRLVLEDLQPILSLFLFLFIGTVIYIGLTYAFQREKYVELRSILKR